MTVGIEWECDAGDSDSAPAPNEGKAKNMPVQDTGQGQDQEHSIEWDDSCEPLPCSGEDKLDIEWREDARAEDGAGVGGGGESYNIEWEDSHDKIHNSPSRHDTIEWNEQEEFSGWIKTVPIKVHKDTIWQFFIFDRIQRSETTRQLLPLAATLPATPLAQIPKRTRRTKNQTHCRLSSED